VPELRYDGPPRLIHGDPQHRNALWDEENKRPVLSDWDSAVIGPVEWDLATIEVHCRRFGFPEQEYQVLRSLRARHPRVGRIRHHARPARAAHGHDQRKKVASWLAAGSGGTPPDCGP
jgi:aminoglycoside phosphotransferase (APT) family kinase protein